MLAVLAVQVLSDREALVPYMRTALEALAARQGERLLSTPGNPISMALTLDSLVRASAEAKAKVEEARAKLEEAEAAGAGQEAGAAAGMEAGGAPGAGGPEQKGREGKQGGGGSGGGSGRAAKVAAAPDVTFFGSMLWQRCVSGMRMACVMWTRWMGARQLPCAVRG